MVLNCCQYITSVCLQICTQAQCADVYSLILISAKMDYKEKIFCYFVLLL